MSKERILSASRMKTLENCAWMYWCSYHLGVPQEQNSGAARGTICHTVFELLLNKRHKKHYDLILKEQDISGSEAVKRLVVKNLKKVSFFDDENYDLCNKMILVGLQSDFFGKGGRVQEPEIAFTLESDDPKFKIRGFIDKAIKYTKDKSVKIVDYKSSKYKFRGDDLTSNFQAMAYTLAALEKWPDYKKVLVEFLFLKYPRSPQQQITISKDQLGGFKWLMAHMYEIINNFDEKVAESNFAAHNPKNRWLCAAGKTWVCPYRDAKDYYVLLDSDGKTLASELNKNKLNADKNQKIEKRTYDGCPAHNANLCAGGSDAFDF